jgi:hypothetical protein
MATEIEPNGTIATSNLLTANVQMIGQASSWYGLTSSADLDYFKFYTSVSGTTQFALTLPSNNRWSYYVEIYDNSGTLQKSYTTANSATYSVAATSAGYSYIAVTAKSTEDYSITTSFKADDLSSAPTYILTSSESGNEGSTATFTLTTTNVASGTSVPYTLSGISAADITGGLLTGSAIVNSSGTATISVGIVADNLTEGAETLTVTAQGKSASMTINDTSKTAAALTITNLLVSQNITGGAGIDTLVYTSNSTAVVISNMGGSTVVTNTATGEVDALINVERIKFADTAIALDISGVSGQAYRVYKAAFNRTPDLGGLGFWISGMDGGVSLNAVAQGFVNSAEFKSVYGASPTNAQIVTRFYDNVLGRAADSGGYNYWLGILDTGQGSVAGVLAAFSESPENQAAVIGVIGNGILYTPYG